MPSHIIHLLVAQQAAKICGLHPYISVSLQNMGSQGPDIFAHNRKTRPLALSYARLLHRKSYGRFVKNLCTIEGSPSNPVFRDWLTGFVTHPCVDRIFHPYIVYRSHCVSSHRLTSVNPARFHAFFERILDSEIYRYLIKEPIENFDAGSALLVPDHDIHGLAHCIAHALLHTYADSAGDRIELRVRNAFIDSMSFYRWTSPHLVETAQSTGTESNDFVRRWGISAVALLVPPAPSPSVDWLNSDHAAWLHPFTGEVSTESVIDLFNKAVEESSCVLAAYKSLLDQLDGGYPIAHCSQELEKLELLIGNGPLSVTDEEGKTASVRFYEPFDLEGELVRCASRYSPRFEVMET